jgi:hypothetical protein
MSFISLLGNKKGKKPTNLPLTGGYSKHVRISRWLTEVLERKHSLLIWNPKFAEQAI